MQDFFSWFRAYADVAKPWLVLGKGPSFSNISEYEVSQYRTIALNHVVRERRVDIAHMIDFDVVDACAEAIERNAGVLLMPWRPHQHNQAGQKTLQELCAINPVLQHMSSAGRLLWYNLRTGEKYGHRDGSPVVPVSYFSFEAAMNLLAMAGVKTVRSLGIDGGASYSRTFDDLRDKTLLSNQHSSFDKQFDEVAKTLFRHQMDYAPLNLQSPVKVFVAATDDQMLSVKVLEYSIRKHASMAVTVIPLHTCGIDVPQPRDAQNFPRTPFSFQRFLIPEICGYQGRAIYMDSDMQVFQDIRKLWTLPMPDAQLLAVGDTLSTQRKPQFSVMLLDCAQLRWNIREIVDQLDAGTLNYSQLMGDMAVADRVRPDIPPVWNSLEFYRPEETALLHYTDMHTQPWVSCDNSNAYLWFEALFAAVDDGFIPESLIQDHIQRSYVRPSVAYQLRQRIADPLLLPAEALAMDRDFVPPYKHMPSYQGVKDPVPSRLKRAKNRLKARVRQWRQR